MAVLAAARVEPEVDGAGCYGSLTPPLAGSSHFSNRSAGRMTGIRLCILGTIQHEVRELIELVQALWFNGCYVSLRSDGTSVGASVLGRTFPLLQLDAERLLVRVRRSLSMCQSWVCKSCWPSDAGSFTTIIIPALPSRARYVAHADWITCWIRSAWVPKRANKRTLQPS